MPDAGFEDLEQLCSSIERSADVSNLRGGAAKATAVASLTAVAAIFGGFMLLALYLLAAKIEINLRNINDSIRAAIKPSDNA